MNQLLPPTTAPHVPKEIDRFESAPSTKRTDKSFADDLSAQKAKSRSDVEPQRQSRTPESAKDKTEVRNTNEISTSEGSQGQKDATSDRGPSQADDQVVGTKPQATTSSDTDIPDQKVSATNDELESLVGDTHELLLTGEADSNIDVELDRGAIEGTETLSFEDDNGLQFMSYEQATVGALDDAGQLGTGPIDDLVDTGMPIQSAGTLPGHLTMPGAGLGVQSNPKEGLGDRSEAVYKPLTNAAATSAVSLLGSRITAEGQADSVDLSKPLSGLNSLSSLTPLNPNPNSGGAQPSLATDLATTKTDYSQLGMIQQVGQQASSKATDGKLDLASLKQGLNLAGPSDGLDNNLKSSAQQSSSFVNVLSAAQDPSLLANQASERMQMPATIRFGQPQWTSMVAERAALMAAQNIESADIRLDPPELGQIQVRVQVGQEQTSVNFVAQNAQVREALEQSSHRLREMLEQQTDNAVDVNVSDQSHQDDEQYSESTDTNQSADRMEGDLTEEALHDTATQIVAKYGVDSYA